MRVKTSPNIGTPSRAMEVPGELKCMFDGKKDAKKFFYVCGNVVMKSKNVEEKVDKLFAFLKADAFDYYFEYFTKDNAPTEEAKSFQVVKKAMLEKFSTKKTEE